MAPRAGGIKSWVLAMLAAKRRLRVAPVPPHAADLTPPARGAPVMPGRDEGTAAAVEPRNNHKQAPRLAVNTICRLQSLAQWWVRLNHAPHTEIRTLPVRIHHVGVAFLQQPIDLPQSVLAASPRTKAVAPGAELDFKDWLDDHLQCCLDNAVLHCRYPQRTSLAVRLGNFHPFDRARPVGPRLQLSVKFQEIPLRVASEPLNALAVHPGCSFVPRNTLPRGFQAGRTDDLVYQTEPFTPSDAVTQRRHHAIRPDRSFRPPQLATLVAGGVSPLLSRSGTAGVLLLHTRPLASSFLPPFPRGGFAARPSRRLPGIGTMKALTPGSLTCAARSLRLPRLAVPAFRPQPRDPSAGRFASRLSAVSCSRLRHT